MDWCCYWSAGIFILFSLFILFIRRDELKKQIRIVHSTSINYYYYTILYIKCEFQILFFQWKKNIIIYLFNSPARLYARRHHIHFPLPFSNYFSVVLRIFSVLPRSQFFFDLSTPERENAFPKTPPSHNLLSLDITRTL